MAEIRIHYRGPVSLAYMLGNMLQEEGLDDIQYEGRLLESRGAEQLVEQLVLLVGVPMLSNAAYDVAKASVMRAIRRFKDRQPNIDIELEDPGSDDEADGLDG